MSCRCRKPVPRPHARLLLLPVPFLPEGLLAFGYIGAISSGVYEDARSLRCVAAKLALQTVVVAMGTQKDVAIERSQNLEGSRIILGDPWVLRVIHEPETGIHIRAAYDHRVIGLAALRDLHGPGSATLRVSGSEMGGQEGAAQFYLVAVM